jgi:hypothetical protein
VPSEGLYFPYIEVPRDHWFMRALLYWDAIGSIIPRQHEEDRQLSTRMRDLMDAGLVRAVYPDAHVWRIPRFEEDFLAFLDRDPTFVRQAGNSLDRSLTVRIHDAKLKAPDRVHREKFNAALVTELCDRGLARRDRGPWIQVEHETAGLFMAYLAARLCELDELAMDPVTSHAERLAPFAMTLPGRLDQSHKETLAVLLPAPTGDVSPRQLVDFKERHRDELRALRDHVERGLLDIALVEADEARRRKLEQLKGELALQVDQLNARISERGWRSDPASTVLQILSPAGPVGVAAITGHFAAAAVGVPALLLAGYLAARRDPSGKASSPLAFAALAQDEFRAVGA